MDKKEILQILKDTVILYDSRKEMYDIATTLSNLGFNLYTSLRNLSFDYKGYFYSKPDDCFIRTNKPSEFSNQLKCEEFMAILSKKHRKIERPEIDPFGEDDWGYEEVAESKNFGFSWIDVNNIISNSYIWTDDVINTLNSALIGKTIVIYKKEKGKYIPFDKIKPKVKVKKFITSYHKNYQGTIILITTENTRIEILRDDMIKIIGNKRNYIDMSDIDSFQEEIWD